MNLKDTLIRCPWCLVDEMYVKYHDEEWGVPVFDDRKHFEFIILESAQAGLSWHSILIRRENYRKAYANFDALKVASFGEKDIEKLLLDIGIIRNRAKIEASVANAKAFISIAEEFGSFSSYLWRFVDGEPVAKGWDSIEQIPAETELGKKVFKDLKSRGFKFFGPKIVYAHLQATGIVNDHIRSCYRFSEICAKHRF